MDFLDLSKDGAGNSHNLGLFADLEVGTLRVSHGSVLAGELPAGCCFP